MNKLTAALWYAEKFNYSIIPVRADKKPYISWEKYQTERADKEQLKAWWKKWPDANIGIVTGKISNLAVIDIDNEEGLKAIQEYIPDSTAFPIVHTPSGGQHYYFTCTDEELTNNSRAIAGCDFRANGGYVLAPPSSNGNGKQYTFDEHCKINKISMVKLPNKYIEYIRSYSFSYNIRARSKNDANENNECRQVSPNVVTFRQGKRDEDIFHVANCLVKGGMLDENIAQVLEIIGKNCDPPFSEIEIQKKIESAIKREEKREKSLADEVREFIVSSHGVIMSSDVVNCLHLSSRSEKKNLSKVLSRLCEEGLIERDAKRNGHYRRIDGVADDIDWMNAPTEILDIKWPFGLEKLVNIYSKNVIIVAGCKDAGKTAFMLNLAKMNMDKFKVNYFSSEMGAAELKIRLEGFEEPMSQFKKIKFKERCGNFADIIKKDDLNIIDFLEINQDHYLIGQLIRDIFDKLDKGVAVIAIQKDFGAKTGRGGYATLEKPRMYLTMENNTVEIKVGKNWAQKALNPAGLKKQYKLGAGCKFIEQSDWVEDIVNYDEIRRGNR